jgi:hypothetical protein
MLTSIRIENSEYPILKIHWKKDEDELGYIGNCVIWDSPDLKEEMPHTVSIRQTLPLGHISVTLDPCKEGCWKNSDFEGLGINEKDLQWATAWASLAIENYKGYYNE